MPERRKPALDLPPFPHLEWDDYFWSGQTVLSSWRGFRSRLGPYGAESSDEESDGSVRLEVASPDEDHQGPPTSEEIRAYEFLLNNEERVRDAVLHAIFNAYPGMRDSYGYDEEEAEELMPAIQQAGELRNLIGLSTVHILCVAKDGVAYVGFEFGCTWDEEHGLGVMTHRDRVIQVGGADTSFLEWVAEQDAKPRRRK